MPDYFVFLISRHYLLKLLIILRMIWVSPYLFLLLIIFDFSWSSNNFLYSGLVFSRNAPAYLTDSIILRAQANPVAVYTDYHLIYITTIVLVLSAGCPSTEEWIKMMWSIYTVGYYSTTKKEQIGTSLLVLVVKTPSFHCRRHGFDPWLGY